MRVIILFALLASICYSQSLKVYNLSDNENIKLDGILNEAFWSKADSISSLAMIDPFEGRQAEFNTVVKIAADNKNIYLGITCYDPEPDKIISISKTRDAYLSDEDRVIFVFDTHLDQRTGYIFAVNPYGTRYDALVYNAGEAENSSWDGTWDAATKRTPEGWTAEIVIPVRILSYNPELREWGFNFERKIERLLERDRWAGLKRDFLLGNVIHAGRLSDLPDFNNGMGVSAKVSTIESASKFYDKNYNSKFDLSADLSQKFRDINAHLTINTDFAETEVDARQTNLTRFPLYFPEKRGFFLEGSDLFDFGIGTGSDVIPFFSRRIGLFNGQKVPILFGGKINGKINGTSFGGIFTRTNSVSGIVPMSSLGVFRIKQDVLEESSIGLIGTIGDPAGKSNEWVFGTDLSYHTSKLFGDKNLTVGLWGLYNKNGLNKDRSAAGFKIDYPNDLLDMALTALRIGDGFSPSLGFVPRSGIKKYSFGADYMPQPRVFNIRRWYFESSFSLITDLKNKWQYWRIFLAPVNTLFESGDRIEFNIAPEGEYLPEDFEISKGVIIPKGSYDWKRYRIEAETASKRLINGIATWWFGSFYNGYLDQISGELNLRPSNSINIGVSYEKNIARLPEGNFTQDLLGLKFQLGLSSSIDLSSFIQYDTESRQIGTNTRLRWMFNMMGDLFLVYNHNVNKLDRLNWQYDSNQLILKFSYGLWF
ncbi:MAG: DUF5916 domain-containing protein [Syntrophomonadaceae bacterium]